MKNITGKQGTQSKQTTRHNQRPDIRDDMDSRKNEEQDFKGDDTTHNKKDTKKEKLKK